jgi:hypothetical protein
MFVINHKVHKDLHKVHRENLCELCGSSFVFFVVKLVIISLP